MGDVFVTGKHCRDMAGETKATEKEGARKSPRTNSFGKGDSLDETTNLAGVTRSEMRGAVTY